MDASSSDPQGDEDEKKECQDQRAAADPFKIGQGCETYLTAERDQRESPQESVRGGVPGAKCIADSPIPGNG